MTHPPTDPGRLSRRDFLRRSAGTVVIAGGLPAILAACTSAGEDTPSPAPSGATGGGATTGTLRVGWSSEPDTLNPLTSFSTEANEVLQLIYDKLNDYDADLNIQCRALAETTTASANGKTVTYALRQGVTWHDGTPFTADDVVFTFSSINGRGVLAVRAVADRHDADLRRSIRRPSRSRTSARRRSTPVWRSRSCPHTSGRT